MRKRLVHKIDRNRRWLEFRYRTATMLRFRASKRALRMERLVAEVVDKILAEERDQGDTVMAAQDGFFAYDVRVFRESPQWDGVDKWWKLGHGELEELYLCTYRIIADEEGFPINEEGQLKEIRQRHPDAVLVY